ncbi:MAG: CCA tRNA nucleotidyltransferase [Acidobacteriaceae bacterium]|jgi:tRNA nucleotidyltransferase/poly(A) polymerase|nr:CCA tRNA nucleotidyltransferase [Acidobacteriaceae bacterium]
MSDYLYTLESHLNAAQSEALATVQTAANEAGLNLFLAGGALRDMIAGFPIRDLNFVVEGNGIALAKAIVKKTGWEMAAPDTRRNRAELLFPQNVRVEIAMAREEKYAKAGAKPTISPATIYEDLRNRDFTINAIAMSLNRASKGLLIDPNNGLGDLERRELRTVSKYTFYDDPVRILRLIRFAKRFQFTIDERTLQQYENVRDANLERKIGAEALRQELHHIAGEPTSAEIVKELDDQGLLTLFCPAMMGDKVNHAGLQKLQKARQNVALELNLPVENMGLFLTVLCEKLAPKERAGLKTACALDKPAVQAWERLDGRVKKLAVELKQPKMTKPSVLYGAAQKAQGAELVYLLYKSTDRTVQDRIKNYLQKYLPAAQEITDEEISEATGIEPGSAKFEKAKSTFIAKRLDARPKKIVEPEAVMPPAPQHPPLVSSVRR